MSTLVDKMFLWLSLIMRKSDKTRENLLAAAHEAFWQKGYSNVSVRDIAQVANVDVALISRYFGGKLGLFEATLDRAFVWPELLADGADPVDVAIGKYANPETDDVEISATAMIVANAGDPEVGDLVRQRLWENIIAPLQDRMGGEAAATNLALFIATILGASMTRQCLRLPAMADASPDEYARQLRHMVDAALAYVPGEA